MNIASVAMTLVLLGIQNPVSQTATQTPATAPQGPKPVTFSDPRLGLLFDHPATWVVEKNKKGRAKSKTEQGLTVMTLPTASSPTGATLEIFHARFASTPEIWQTVEQRSNEQLHRKVERQWQQDILGVPLLLTRISYPDKAGPVTTLTGLLYTRTHEKLLFRLQGPSADFDNVQYAFTQSMQTLRTVDGVMPVEEDPEHPLPPAKKTDPLPAARIPIVPIDKKPIKYYVAPQSVPLVISTRKLVFHYPLDWKVVNSTPTSVTLKGDDVSAPVTLTFASTLDSDSPANALMALTDKDLSLFDSVALRIDSPQFLNKAGCAINSVWRDGKNSKGALYTLQSTGLQGEFYFVCDFTGTTADDSEDDRKAVEDLLKSVSLLPQP